MDTLLQARSITSDQQAQYDKERISLYENIERIQGDLCMMEANLSDIENRINDVPQTLNVCLPLYILWLVGIIKRLVK